MAYQVFKHQYFKIQETVSRLAKAAGRAENEISIMAVTKTQSSEKVSWAAQLGVASVGENRVQEAIDKQQNVEEKVRWELIGHLQRNKARLAVASFHRIQSLDSLRLAESLNRLAAEIREEPLPVLLQFNTGRDPKKYGFAPEEGGKVIDAIMKMDHLRLDGLMTIAPYTDDVDERKRCFSGLRLLRDDLAQRSGLPLEVLSMGMTDDMKEAIYEGSTLVRIGSALFGARSG